MVGSPDLDRYLRAAGQALKNKDLTLASRIAADAEAAGHRDHRLLALAVHHHITANDFPRALVAGERAFEAGPDSSDALGAYAFSLVASNRPAEALPLFDKALALAPRSAPLVYNRGFALECLGEIKAARGEYARALALDPGNAESLGRAAYLAALQGDMTDARAMGTRALSLNTSNIAAAAGVSLAEIGEGEFDKVEGRLKPFAESASFDAQSRIMAYGIIGDAFHESGDADRAFAAYRMKSAISEIFARRLTENQAFETQLERVRRLERYFQGADPAAWRETRPGNAPVATHAFVLGFARSGTTLLEQVLASHPAVEAMDERDGMHESYPFTDSDAGLDRLASLKGAALDVYRQDYWRRAREQAGMTLDRAVFVDKMPMSSVVLCLIAKLFPDAKIVFTLRDPRDVVLSCFRRRFAFTPQLIEMVTLERVAAYYDAVMALAQAYRKVLALDIHDLRYEDLVGDFDGACARLCAFLGVDVDPAMRDFARTAAARDINTPSAAQVVRELGGRGVGQWRPYEKHLAPVLPVLAPWVEKFGYPAE